MEICECINGVTFTSDDVSRCINELDVCSNPGPDNIHPLVVRNSCFGIVDWLTDAFNASLRLGIYPEIWRCSYIIPIHKGGSLSDVNNYRPINKYGVFAKMLDHLVYDKIAPLLCKYVVTQQHGFMPKKSTITNLSIYHDFLVEHLNRGLAIDSIYTDLSRAFDTVNINLLLRKLQAYGVCGTTLSWFSSFLKDREQIVVIRGTKSRKIRVLSGVGQGTHLGPLLFLLFINDLVSKIKYSEILLFADDAKLFHPVVSQLDLIELQEDLHSFHEWCIENGLSCNINKCSYLRFGHSNVPLGSYTIDNTELQIVQHTRDLGVIFDCQLSFKKHIEFVFQKANKLLYFIKRFASRFKSSSTFRQIYFSYLYPTLTYGSLIWFPHEKGLIKLLESINHRFLRFVSFRIGYNMHYTDHYYTPMYSCLGISNLSSAQTRTEFLFAMKLIFNLIDCPQLLNRLNFYVPPRVLRDNSYLFNPLVLRQSQLTPIIFRIQKVSNELLDWIDPFKMSFISVHKISSCILCFE